MPVVVDTSVFVDSILEFDEYRTNIIAEERILLQKIYLKQSKTSLLRS